jgi:hypothetical protein
MNFDTLALVALALAAIPCGLFLVNLWVYRPLRKQKLGSAEPISVLIPARNEEKNIRATLAAVLANRDAEFEVIVLDDHSTDGTASIVSEFAARDPRVRLEGAPPLPAGWCGKQHACHILAGLSRNPLLVFIDADVRLAHDALARMAQFMEARPQVALASGMPRQELGTLSERLLLPLIHFVLLGYLPMPFMRWTRRPAFSAGCGQLFISRADAYRAAGGHAGIRATLHDGVKLPRLFRHAGFQTDLFDATDVASCRMYQTNTETWHGLGKNATEGLAAPGAIVPMTVLLFGGQVVPFALLACAPLLSSEGFVFALSAAVLALLPRLIASFRFRQPLRSALVHPLGVLGLLAIQWLALARKLAGQPMHWKGRAYASVTTTPEPAAPRAMLFGLGVVLAALAALAARAGSPPSHIPSAATNVTLASFVLRDQFDTAHTFSFPRTNVLLLTVADKQGNKQMDGWVLALKSRFGTRLEIAGIADVRGVPGLWHGSVREKFQKLRTHPVMMDWEGAVISALPVEKHRANVFLLNRDGAVLRRVSGPADAELVAEFCSAVDTALVSAKP